MCKDATCTYSLGSNVYAELEACTEIIQYKIFVVAEPLPIEVNVNEPAVGTLSPSELNMLNYLIEAKPILIIRNQHHLLSHLQAV